MKESDFELPGFGGKTKENCNKVISINYCTDCGHIEPNYYHCKNWRCPECYAVSAGRAAHRIEDRLLGVRSAYEKICKKLGKIIHVILSPPQERLEKIKLKDLKAEAKEHLKNLGVLGGTIIFHPFRIKEEYIDKLAVLLRKHEEETGKKYKGGFWRFIHDNPLNLESWRDYVKFGIHFHIIGFYPKVIIKSNEFFKSTSWTYKAVSINKVRSAFRTARYQLTHQNITSKKTYEYFGVCEPNRTNVTEETFLKFLKCRKCDSDNYYKFRCSDTEYQAILEGRIRPTTPLSVVEGGNVPNVYEKKIIRSYEVRLKTLPITEGYL